MNCLLYIFPTLGGVDLESKSIIKHENEEEYPFPGDFYEENNANCDMNYDENEMEPWPSELDDIGEENAKNNDIIRNPAAKRPKYIYR